MKESARRRETDNVKVLHAAIISCIAPQLQSAGRLQAKLTSVPGIVAKKRDPGILDPELFLAQIRKVEARLGKLAKIRKVGTD